MYHSQKDKTLQFAFPIGDAREFDHPLGWKGPPHTKIIESQCPEVFVVDCKNVASSHGGYRTAGAYLL